VGFSLSLSLSLYVLSIACNFALTFSIVVKEMVSLRKTPDDELFCEAETR
jgi:hypothetical protein